MMHLKNVAFDGDLDCELDGSMSHNNEFDGEPNGEVDGRSKCLSRC